MADPPALPEGLRVTLAIARALESVGARYCLGGSLASSLHGTPRSTLDADLVTDLSGERVGDFLAAVGPAFFVEPERVEQAVARRGSFNLIHQHSLFKVDVFIQRQDALAAAEMERRQEVILEDGESLFVATPEDILLEKLRWFRLGNEVSQRQWGDVLGIVRVQGKRLDRDYLARGAAAAGLADLLARAYAEDATAQRP